MKNCTLFTLLISIFFLFSCENKNEDVFNGILAKGELGTTEIASVTSVRDSTATLNCVMSFKGKGYLLARGVCWSTTEHPTIENGHVEVKDTGTVILKMSKLTPGTLYYVRPYVTNNEGTGYGNELSFTTKNVPTITIVTTPTNLTAISATITGAVSNDGGDSVMVRGVCWGTSTKPTITLTTKTTNGAGKGTFNADLSGLIIGTTYYARAYATNIFGTAYSSEITFTTQNLPTLSTTTITNITTVTATSGGTISTDGGSAVIARGVCWSTSQNPTIDLTTKTNDGIGIGSFTSTLVNLQLSTTYYVRAYATNALGTSYGAQQTFTTNGYATVTTNSVSSITPTTSITGGNVSSDGGSTITARGVCWSTSVNPTISNSKTSDGTGSGAFTSSLTGLAPNTSYYVRAYATNNVGTTYGSQLNFTTTPISVPTITTTSLSSITTTTASSGGTITNDGGATITARGVCWSTISNPTIINSFTSDGTGTGSFTSSITGLTASTTYYVRAYATNSVGTNYGNQISLTTLTPTLTLPTVTTTTISGITSTSATGGGNVTSDGGATVTVKGICWSTSTNPIYGSAASNYGGTGTGAFTCSLPSLTKSTTYYVRAYATNSVGTAYGNQVSFTTTTPVTLTVGQSYQGGIIAYIFQSGDVGYIAGETHGIIAAPSDQSTSIKWYNGTAYVAIGTTGSAIGTGNANTNTIVSKQGSGTYAAKLCYDLILAGYSDWYLPSRSEFIAMYQNASLIGGFSGNYWTSTANSTGDGAEAFEYSGTYIENTNMSFHVRAIRNF